MKPCDFNSSGFNLSVKLLRAIPSVFMTLVLAQAPNW